MPKGGYQDFPRPSWWTNSLYRRQLSGL